VFIEPLTDRESELLGLLPTHLTYREMANELCVSINTVKTYQKSVFRKLGATSRSHAVGTARAEGLIPAAR
jgi:LuxR family maltose regulon positive regulatory protein